MLFLLNLYVPNISLVNILIDIDHLVVLLGDIPTTNYKYLLKTAFSTRELNYIIVPSNKVKLKCQKES